MLELMHSDPDMIQCAASFDWEALLPILFFLLYGIAQLFGGKKKKEESSPPDEDALERARQIREEIRRKIEARKEAARGPVQRPEYDPTLPDGQQRRPQQQQRKWQPQQRELPTRQGPLQSPVRREAPAPMQQKRMPEAHREKSLEEMLREKQHQVEESRRKMKEARIRAQEMLSPERSEQVKGVRRRNAAAALLLHKAGISLHDQLLLGLQHPNSIRQAIVYKEILDKPLGLR